MIECSAKALFVLTDGALTNPAFCRDLAQCLDALELEHVIMAYLGPAAGGAEFAVHYGQCPQELKQRGLMGKLAFEWHTGAGFRQVCLHKVVKALSGPNQSALSSKVPASKDTCTTSGELRTTTIVHVHADTVHIPGSTGS